MLQSHRGYITRQMKTINKQKKDVKKLKQLEMQLKEKLQMAKDLEEQILELIAD